MRGSIRPGIRIACGVFAVTCWVVTGSWIGPAPATAAAGGYGATKTSPRRPLESHGLADSVLAQVNASRAVTVGEFRHAWTQVGPPARADSLTPEGAREFLDLLIGKELMGETALRETWQWTARESAQYLALEDRLVMSMALDSALKATQRAHLAQGLDSLPPSELGTTARNDAIQRLGVAFDQALLEKLAKAWAAIPKPPPDSGIFAALRALGVDPKIDPTDVDRIVARWPDGHFAVNELMAYWRRLNPLQRPRVDVADQMRDLVSNGIFERLLRDSAERRHLAQWPAIRAELDKQRELLAVTHFVEREVYSHVPTDSASLSRYYLEHVDAWELPPRARLLRLVLPDRKQANQMALKLRDPSQVDSLVAKAQAVGVSYYAEYSAETDSSLFRRAMQYGPGTVLGPDSTSKGWAVSRVTELMSGRARPFSEVRELVRHGLYGDSAEQLMQGLLERLRRKAKVVVNERALAGLTER